MRRARVVGGFSFDPPPHLSRRKQRTVAPHVSISRWGLAQSRVLACIRTAKYVGPTPHDDVPDRSNYSAIAARLGGIGTPPIGTILRFALVPLK